MWPTIQDYVHLSNNIESHSVISYLMQFLKGLLLLYYLLSSTFIDYDTDSSTEMLSSSDPSI